MAHGHQVVGVAVGMGSHRQLPAFFASVMPTPVTVLATPEFVFKHDRGVALPATLLRTLQRLPEYRRSLRQLHALVQATQPDVIVNFFEPLAGLYALTRRKRPPVVAVGHQFMFEHPDYVRAHGLRMQQWGMKWFVRVVGSASTRVALSLYAAPDLPRKSLVVCPPVLRRQLFELQPDPAGKFVLVYLVNHGYSEAIIQWHRQHPETELHCFYAKPNAPAEERHSPNLTFHALNGEKFLRMMGECRAVVCTAGFESVSEAAYLGKPLFMVPVENHVEQQINAIDAVTQGLGITDRSFNLDRLGELPERLSNGKFCNWLAQAETILLRTLEQAVAGSKPQPGKTHSQPEPPLKAAASTPAPAAALRGRSH